MTGPRFSHIYDAEQPDEMCHKQVTERERWGAAGLLFWASLLTALIVTAYAFSDRIFGPAIGFFNTEFRIKETDISLLRVGMIRAHVTSMSGPPFESNSFIDADGNARTIDVYSKRKLPSLDAFTAVVVIYCNDQVETIRVVRYPDDAVYVNKVGVLLDRR
jgi:hypothetical protein